MPGPKLDAQLADAAAFLAVFRTQVQAGGLFLPGATLEGSRAAMGVCAVSLRIGGAAPIEFSAQLASVVPGAGVAVIFSEGVPAPLRELAERLQAPAAREVADEGRHPAVSPGGGPQDEASLGDGSPAAVMHEADAHEVSSPAAASHEVPSPDAAPRGPLVDRLKEMSVAEKMQLGLAGEREARGFLLRDNNKAVHLYVLRNPRIGLDEVLFAAKNPSLAPEALKFIAEHREWGMNGSVCAALAKNPKLAIPLVLKLLPRVPLPDLRAIAKGSGRQQVVHAARKLLNPV